MEKLNPQSGALSVRRARTQWLAQQLRTTLEREIDEGRIQPGQHLATERELAAQFGASRTVVRAALAELDKVGKIMRRVGCGTVVKPMPAAGLHRVQLDPVDASPLELLNFRLALEPGLAEAMTLNASEGDLRSIQTCLEQGDAASGWEEWERCDRNFHLRLVTATHNRLAIGLYQLVIAIRHEQPWTQLKRAHTDTPRWKKYQDDHRQIAAAVIARDPSSARDALQAHLINVRAKMLGSP
jgi:GntR family transcriptional regulator, uxu operon transcriptional repressor